MSNDQQFNKGPVIEPPPRTECACAECVKCCKVQPASLAPGDYERIRNHLQLDDAAARERFRSSNGAVVEVRQSNGMKVQRRQRSIVPLYDRHRKRCTFLGDDDRCTIHAVKPAGCAVFDTHMDLGKAQARSYWLLMQQSDADYQRLRQELKATTHDKARPY